MPSSTVKFSSGLVFGMRRCNGAELRYDEFEHLNRPAYGIFSGRKFIDDGSVRDRQDGTGHLGLAVPAGRPPR
jgi:hypothetical protein